MTFARVIVGRYRHVLQFIVCGIRTDSHCRRLAGHSLLVPRARNVKLIDIMRTYTYVEWNTCAFTDEEFPRNVQCAQSLVSFMIPSLRHLRTHLPLKSRA